MFYRNLGIPVKQVNNFAEISLQEYGSALELSQKQLDEQIQEFAQMQRRIQLQKERYDTLQQLMAEPYRVERLPFRYVVGREFWERENCCGILRTRPAMCGSGIHPAKIRDARD